MPTELELCNRALSMVGTRSTVTALNETSNEALNWNILFIPLRDQVLRMANWNFARKTNNLSLVKAAPGTPESPATSFLQWSPAYPAPPWLYEYAVPEDCQFFRYLIPSMSSETAGPPIFTSGGYTYGPNFVGPPQRFISATDAIGVARAIIGISKEISAAVTSPLHGFANDQTVYISSVIGMRQVNNRLYTIHVTGDNTFRLGVDSTTFDPYVSGGVAVNQSMPFIQSNVILTNTPWAIGTYTFRNTDLDLWDDTSIQALVSVCAGFLAIPLTGDKDLAKLLISQANSHILGARVNDGNEGMTIQDFTPDWIRARGISQDGFYNGYLVAPYPPLFAIA